MKIFSFLALMFSALFLAGCNQSQPASEGEAPVTEEAMMEETSMEAEADEEAAQ